jgi:hypothetical protein
MPVWLCTLKDIPQGVDTCEGSAIRSRPEHLLCEPIDWCGWIDLLQPTTGTLQVRNHQWTPIGQFHAPVR